jgi:hypothetical protein
MSITIFCAFTRDWAVDPWLADLASVHHDPASTNLAIIVDADEPGIKRKFEKFAKEKGYRKLVCVVNEDWQPNEVRIAVRRQRIADVKTQSKELIAQCDGEIVIGFEDDTVFTDMDLMRLIRPLNDPKVGFVEGVQCGRWGVKMIGAWAVDDYKSPKRIETLLPSKGYQEIDGGGWYGYATRKELYLEHDYNWPNVPWGPDVEYGLWLRNKGLKCLIDWETVFGHSDHGRILYPDTKVTKIIYNKDVNGQWLRGDIET